MLVTLILTVALAIAAMAFVAGQSGHTGTLPWRREAVSDLSNPIKKRIALQLVAASENSTLDWHTQYGYIEHNVESDNNENRGYTAGVIGFTSRTGDMLDLVKYYSHIAPGNVLEKYLPALEAVKGSSGTAGLGEAFENDWQTAAQEADGKFITAQDHERDSVYFTPAVELAKKDGLQALGQFMYYDTAIVHGPEGLAMIRAAARKSTHTSAEGGDEATYLNRFLDIRTIEMRKEHGHQDTSRIDTMQRKLLNERNFTLHTPFTVAVYDDVYTIK
jgi:chitosanase